MIDKDKLNIMQVILSIISLICIWFSWFTTPTDWEFFNLTPGSLFLCGAFCSLLFIISTLDKIFKPILDVFLIKTTIFGAFTSFIIICTSQASVLLNKIYSTDTDIFIYSKIFITGILVFKKATPFLVIIFALMLIIYLWYFGYTAKELFSLCKLSLCNKRDDTNFRISDLLRWIEKNQIAIWNLIKYLLFSLTTFTCVYFTYKFNWEYFSEKILDEKAYIIANSLDFYPNTICKLNGFHVGARILYLDSSHKNILVDNNPPEERDIWEILTTYTEVEFIRIMAREGNLHIVECIPRKSLIVPHTTIIPYQKESGLD